MDKIDNETTVVILDSDGLWGLGILRSLGRIGVPLYVASSNPQALAFCSRYCKGTVLSDICDFTENSVLSLLSIGSKIGTRPILIPTTDRSVIFVAEHADALRTRFTFPYQSSDLIRSLCSKKELYYLAKKLKIPTPEAVFPNCKEDVFHFLETASFPIMLKPIYARASVPLDKVIVHTPTELVEKYEAMENPDYPNLMMQELIPGGDSATWLFEGYFDESSTSLFDVTGRKLRQWRRYHGLTSLGICLRNETVERTTREFMKAIGYRGIVDIGYRYDARDGQYKILDFNPRIGATFRLFVGDNGMDVARALYLDLTGQHVTPDSVTDGRKWLIEGLDFASSALYILDGKMSITQWLSSYRGVREVAYFGFDDPLPFMHLSARNLRAFSSQIRVMVSLANQRRPNRQTPAN
jgi:predicted ATP-grasp superfamily ATP-dependent carboligase